MVVTILETELDGVGDFLSVGEPSAQTQGRDFVQCHCDSCKQCSAEYPLVYHCA